jgi:hypothetical protein
LAYYLNAHVGKAAGADNGSPCLLQKYKKTGRIKAAFQVMIPIPGFRQTADNYIKESLLNAS